MIEIKNNKELTFNGWSLGDIKQLPPHALLEFKKFIEHDPDALLSQIAKLEDVIDKLQSDIDDLEDKVAGYE